MKRIFFLIIVIIAFVSNIYAQQTIKPDFKIPELEYRNCYDTIILFEKTCDIYIKDTLPDGNIILYVLITWGYYKDESKLFPVEISGTYEKIKQWEQNPYISNDSTKTYPLINYHTGLEVRPKECNSKRFVGFDNFGGFYCIE